MLTHGEHRKRHLDEPMVDAIRLLAEAVRFEQVSEVVQFKALERALEAALANPTENMLAMATLAFNALGGEHRRRVATRAETLARMRPEAEQASWFADSLFQGLPKVDRIDLERSPRQAILRPPVRLRAAA